jgi:hypothetical protein
MSPTIKSVRIGNAQAFWGDRSDAAAEMLALEPELDYLTLDYLAEVSMSILAMQRERDPAAGFAREFVDVVRSLAPYWSSSGRCRVITNAGGLNPHGCAETCRAALAEAGCRTMKIGVVSGDDVLPLMRNIENASLPGFRNLDTGKTLHDVRDRLVTANAYVGASPIVEALAGEADIVITGRVADPSLTVAPCIHHFGWTETDLNRLAGATIAGHLIECGTQVTGGISTDWLDVPDAARIGFPIIEVSDDGSCVVTKPRGAGGHVTEMTVKEQLLYEISDPSKYLSPDVTVSFQSLSVQELGQDRVRVFGATGTLRPDTFKVSATYRDGYRAVGTLTIIGRDSEAKAKRVGEYVVQRVRDAGFSLRDSVVECLGSRGSGEHSSETVLRVAVEAESREAVERFSRELTPYITAGPQGTTGYAEGRPRVHPVFRYWPCLISRGLVAPKVEFVSSEGRVRGTQHVTAHTPNTSKAGLHSVKLEQHLKPVTSNTHRATHLYDIACARSGDKGIGANVGVIVRQPEDWSFLQEWLSADRVAEIFGPLGVESVDRYELPNLRAINFVLHGILRQNLQTDAQGKALGQRLLELELPADFSSGKS